MCSAFPAAPVVGRAGGDLLGVAGSADRFLRRRAGRDAARLRAGARRRQLDADASAADRRHRRRRLRCGGGADAVDRARHKLRGMLFWLMGDLGAGNVRAGGAGVLAGPCWSLPCPSRANSTCWRAAAAGTQRWASNVARLRRGVYFWPRWLTAAAVTQVGSIGFVGLVVPHLVRLALGNDQRLLLPASVLAGGSCWWSPTRWRAASLPRSSCRSAC
jgi:hypothetical protein